MIRNNLNGLAWVHPKVLMPVLTSSNIYFGGKKKGELELHKKSKLAPPPSSSQNLKGRKARHFECTLGPSIGCMKFLFPKEFITIFGLGYLPKNTHTQLQRTAYILTAVTSHAIIN
jgi:hypothetical protein